MRRGGRLSSESGDSQTHVRAPEDNYISTCTRHQFRYHKRGFGALFIHSSRISKARQFILPTSAFYLSVVCLTTSAPACVQTGRRHLTATTSARCLSMHQQRTPRIYQSPVVYAIPNQGEDVVLARQFMKIVFSIFLAPPRSRITTVTSQAYFSFLSHFIYFSSSLALTKRVRTERGLSIIYDR